MRRFKSTIVNLELVYLLEIFKRLKGYPLKTFIKFLAESCIMSKAVTILRMKEWFQSIYFTKCNLPFHFVQLKMIVSMVNIYIFYKLHENENVLIHLLDQKPVLQKVFRNVLTLVSLFVLWKGEITIKHLRKRNY